MKLILYLSSSFLFLPTTFLLLLLLLGGSDALDYCDLPELEGCPSGGCRCGPEYATNFAEAFAQHINDFLDFIDVDIEIDAPGVDKWKIMYTYHDPFRRTRTDVFNFHDTCQRHDDCYWAISDYPTHCDKKFQRCNDFKFKEDLYDVCSKGRWSCQRSYCKDIIADTFLSIVRDMEETYKDDAGCTSGNEYSIKSHHNTYLNMGPKQFENAGIGTRNLSWEKWDLQQMQSGKWAFYNIEHGMYLCAHPGGGVTSVSWIKEWEQFTLEELEGTGRYAFKSHHGTYLRAWPSSRNGRKIDLADKLQSYEMWTIDPPVPKTRSEVL